MTRAMKSLRQQEHDPEATTCCSQPEPLTLTEPGSGRRSVVCLNCEAQPALSYRDAAHDRGEGWFRTGDRETPWVQYPDGS